MKIEIKRGHPSTIPWGIVPLSAQYCLLNPNPGRPIYNHAVKLHQLSSIWLQVHHANETCFSWEPAPNQFNNSSELEFDHFLNIIMCGRQKKIYTRELYLVLRYKQVYTGTNQYASLTYKLSLTEEVLRWVAVTVRCRSSCKGLVRPNGGYK